MCRHTCIFPAPYKELSHTGLAQALGPKDTSMEAEEQGHEVILLTSRDGFNLSANDVPKANLPVPPQTAGSFICILFHLPPKVTGAYNNF